jgi:hypothetical protein
MRELHIKKFSEFQGYDVSSQSFGKQERALLEQLLKMHDETKRGRLMVSVDNLDDVQVIMHTQTRTSEGQLLFRVDILPPF